VTTPAIRANPTVISVGPTSQIICPPVGGTVLIYNADPVNTAYVGYSVDISQFNATAIPALTYSVMDGSRQLYAVCPTATVLLNVTPGGTYQSASAAEIAAQIALSGVTFAQPTTLLAVSQISAGATWSLPQTTFKTGSAYEIALSSLIVAQAFVTDIKIEHLDASGNIILTEFLTVSNYPNSNNARVLIRGNLAGTQLLITGQSATSAFINTVAGSSLTAGTILVSLYSMAAPWASTVPKVQVFDNNNGMGDLIHAQVTALAANQDLNVGMVESYVGEAYFNYISNTAAMTILPLLAAYSVANGTSSIFDTRFPTAGNNSPQILPFAMSGYWLRFQMLNTTANAGSFNANIAQRDYF
jgi:hypothetical protein